MLTAELTGRNPGFSFAEDTDDLFVGKTLLHGDVLMWLMKTLLTSVCINQRGAGRDVPRSTFLQRVNDYGWESALAHYEQHRKTKLKH